MKSTKQELQFASDAQRAMRRLPSRLSAVKEAVVELGQNSEKSRLEVVQRRAIELHLDSTATLEALGRLVESTRSRVLGELRKDLEEGLDPQIHSAIDASETIISESLRAPILGAIETVRAISSSTAYTRAKLALTALDWGKVGVLDTIPWSGLGLKVLDTLRGKSLEEEFRALVESPIASATGERILDACCVEAMFTVTVSTATLKFLNELRSDGEGADAG